MVIATLCLGGGCAETGAAGQDRSILPSGAVVSAYDDRVDADRLRTRLTGLRAGFGRGPAAPFMLAQAHLTEAKERIAKGGNPENALEYTLRGSADDGERTVRLWCLGTRTLDTFRFPRVLLTATPLNVAIAVLRDSRPETAGYFVLLATYSLDENIMQHQ